MPGGCGLPATRPSVWAAVLFGVALLARQWGGVLQAGLSIASILYGSLLGVFLLGLLTRRVGENAAMCAMAAGLVLMLYIRSQLRSPGRGTF